MSDIGKTIANIEVQEWAGTDTFKDTVTWERTIITFTDGTATQFDAWDGERYDEYRCTFDDEGQPIAYVETTATCRRCGREIGQDNEGRWVDPEATGDDSVWRETCDENHEDRIAAHEPRPIVPSLEERLAAPIAAEPMTCTYCGQSIKRGDEGLLVDSAFGDWWCRANMSNGGDAAPHEMEQS